MYSFKRYLVNKGDSVFTETFTLRKELGAPEHMNFMYFPSMLYDFQVVTKAHIHSVDC